MRRKAYKQTVLFPYGIPIRAIQLDAEIAEKILVKHNVMPEHIQAVFEGKPVLRRVGGEQFLALGQAAGRGLAVFFRYDSRSKKATITTAYPAGTRQRTWHNTMKK